jgi:hypothetical protein
MSGIRIKEKIELQEKKSELLPEYILLLVQTLNSVPFVKFTPQEIPKKNSRETSFRHGIK